MPLLAYFIMPVGSDAEYEAKRSVLEISTRSCGWTTHFPLDSISAVAAEASHFETAAVLDEMKAADLIVADLSLERPSCYYELGLAQSLDGPTLVLAATGTTIHQLAGREEVRFYADFSELAALMISALEK